MKSRTSIPKGTIVASSPMRAAGELPQREQMWDIAVYFVRQPYK